MRFRTLITVVRRYGMIEPDAVWLYVNMMHAYLFSGQLEKAKEIC